MEFIKLNIQLFGAFAEKTNDELRSTSNPKNKGTLYASLTEIDPTDEDKEKNQTRIKCYCKFTQVTGSYTQYSAPYLRLYWFDDNEHTKGIEVAKEQVHTMNYGSVGKTKELSYTITAKHKEDGTLKGYVKAKWEYDGSGQLPCQTGYATTDNTPLTAIPRAKTISALSADIGYDTTITLKQTSATYTATITYQCGNESGTIANKTTETSVGWKIPTSIYSQLTSTEKEKTITLYATTYNGDKQVGETQSTTIKARVNAEDNRPIAKLTAKDVNEATLSKTNGENVVVLNASNILCNAQGLAKNGATIKSMKLNGISLSGFTYRDVTSSDGADVTQVALKDYTFNKATTNKYTLEITDSRDNKSVITSDSEKTLSKIDYIVPKFSSATMFKRNTPTDGKVNVTYKGNVFNGSFGKVNNTDNIKVYYAWKEKSASSYSSWIELPMPTLSGNTFSNTYQLQTSYDYTKAYDFKITIVDALNGQGIVTYTQSVTKGKPVYWWNDDSVNVLGSLTQRNYLVPFVKKSKNLLQVTLNKKDITAAYNSLIRGDFYAIAGQQYTISFNTNNNGGAVYLHEDLKADAYYFTHCDGNRKTMTFIAKETKDFNNANILTPSKAVTTAYDITDIQIEMGSKATEFEPYDASSYMYINRGGGNELIDINEKYTRREQVIGTWLGKPLYRKVVEYGALPNATSKYISHNITDIDTYVSIRGFAYQTNTTDPYTMPLPFVSTALTSNVTLSCNKTAVLINTGTDRTNYYGFVILEYTKTTD